MRSEWPEQSLEELCKLIVDCPHSTPEWTDTGVVVLRNQYIRNGRLDLSAPSYTTEDGYRERVKRATPTEGDIVITREAPMGEVCQIPSGLKCCLGQRMVLLRADPKKVIPEYLLFALQSPYVKHQISWNEGTGTTVSNIRLPNLRAFRIPTPKIQLQKYIAQILCSIDDKIELNRQTNATLEAMAQALFKSWFVDFDPVIDNALTAGNPIPEELQARAQRRAHYHEQNRQQPNPQAPLPQHIATLFPNRFVESETLGWVPEGWGTGFLKDVVSIVYGKGLPTNKLKESGYPVFGGNGVIGFFNKFLYEEPQTLISCRGAASGKVLKSLPYSFVTNNSLVVEHKQSSLSFEYLYYSLKNQDLLPYVSGSAQPQMTIANLNPVQILIPEAKVIEAFSDQIKNFDSKSLLNDRQSETLAKLRDTLLPKLLSGQLRLPDAEKHMAEAL